MPNPSLIMGGCAIVYFLVLARRASKVTVEALEEGDLDALGMRVFKSLTRTTLFLGFPLLFAVLMILAYGGSPGGGGIMSKGMGLAVLFIAGCFGLFGLWLSMLTMGFVGVMIVRRFSLAPRVGGLLMFALLGVSPALFSAIATYQDSLSKYERDRIRRGRQYGELPLAPEYREESIGIGAYCWSIGSGQKGSSTESPARCATRSQRPS